MCCTLGSYIPQQHMKSVFLILNENSHSTTHFRPLKHQCIRASCPQTFTPHLSLFWSNITYVMVKLWTALLPAQGPQTSSGVGISSARSWSEWLNQWTLNLNIYFPPSELAFLDPETKVELIQVDHELIYSMVFISHISASGDIAHQTNPLSFYKENALLGKLLDLTLSS